MNSLISIGEAKQLILSGASLTVAGSPAALKQLPQGKWVAGSTHYFIGPDGGVHSDDVVFVCDLGAHGSVRFAVYSSAEVDKISTDSPENGFSVVIIPAASESLRRFAQRPYSAELFMKAVVGWVAGVDLNAIHSTHAQVVDGTTGQFHADAVVVAHVSLPASKMASISIVNPFERSAGPVIQFEATGFHATHCLIDGKRHSLSDFLIEHGNRKGRLPLIGNFSGANINVSIQSIDTVSGNVCFYAPVFAGVEYTLAAPLADYSKAFEEALAAQHPASVAFSCNCILNYLYGDMKGRRTGCIQGPITFGEVSYQLVNQTMVLLNIV